MLYLYIQRLKTESAQLCKVSVICMLKFIHTNVRCHNGVTYFNRTVVAYFN